MFVRTQLGADRLTENLQAVGIKAEAIHGGLPQSARRRALEAFTDARSPVLVATDVAARGIHVDDVSLVLHYDPPADRKTYLHRSGRTARAGAGGVVVSLLLPDQVGQAKRRFRQAKVDPRVSRIRPGDAPIAELVASGVPVEPVERPARPAHRFGAPASPPSGDARRDGERRGAPSSAASLRTAASAYGDRDRSGGERHQASGAPAGPPSAVAAAPRPADGAAARRVPRSRERPALSGLSGRQGASVEAWGSAGSFLSRGRRGRR